MSIAEQVERLLGHRFEPLPIAWTQRDLLLYAASIGARMDEPSIAYEGCPTWTPMPTAVLALMFKGTEQGVVDFQKLRFHGSLRSIPGMPFDNLKPGNSPTLHAEESLESLRPLPFNVAPEDGWTLSKVFAGIHDSGKGIRIEQVHTLLDGKGVEYARMIYTLYTAGDFGLNRFSKSIAPKQPIVPLRKPPSRRPDAVATETPPEQIALFYRLVGDYNPLHADPAFGKKAFGGAINHGLCAFGYAARAILSAARPGDPRPNDLAYIRARFASPVKPGDPLETRIWFDERPAASGQRVVHFEQLDVASGKLSIAGGVALLGQARLESHL